MVILETKQPLELLALLAQSDLPAIEVQPVIGSLIQQRKVIGIGQGEHRLLLTTLGWERLTKQVTTALQDYHRRFPTRLGMPKVELTSRLKLGAYSSTALQRLCDEGILVEQGTIVRSPSHQVQLTQAQQAKINVFLKSLAQNPYAPPSDLIPEPDLLNLLIERGQVVKVSSSVVFTASVYSEMVEKTVAHIRAQGKVTLGEFRDLFNTSRKYAQAFLEHLDEKKITRRVGDERVLC